MAVAGMARATAVVFEAVKKFDGSGDFAVWQIRVKDLLTQQGILVGLKAKRPEKMEDDEWEEKQAQAAAIIRFCLSDEVVRRVIGLETPKEIWDELERQFLPKKDVPDKEYMKKKKSSLKMEKGSSLADHIDAFRRMVRDFEPQGLTIDDDEKSIIFLCSLP